MPRLEREVAGVAGARGAGANRDEAADAFLARVDGLHDDGAAGGREAVPRRERHGPAATGEREAARELDVATVISGVHPLRFATLHLDGAAVSAVSGVGAGALAAADLDATADSRAVRRAPRNDLHVPAVEVVTVADAEENRPPRAVRRRARVEQDAARVASGGAPGLHREITADAAVAGVRRHDVDRAGGAVRAGAGTKHDGAAGPRARAAAAEGDVPTSVGGVATLRGAADEVDRATIAAIARADAAPFARNDHDAAARGRLRDRRPRDERDAAAVADVADADLEGHRAAARALGVAAAQDDGAGQAAARRARLDRDVAADAVRPRVGGEKGDHAARRGLRVAAAHDDRAARDAGALAAAHADGAAHAVDRAAAGNVDVAAVAREARRQRAVGASRGEQKLAARAARRGRPRARGDGEAAARRVGRGGGARGERHGGAGAGARLARRDRDAARAAIAGRAGGERDRSRGPVQSVARRHRHRSGAVARSGDPGGDGNRAAVALCA